MKYLKGYKIFENQDIDKLTQIADVLSDIFDEYDIPFIEVGTPYGKDAYQYYSNEIRIYLDVTEDHDDADWDVKHPISLIKMERAEEICQKILSYRERVESMVSNKISINIRNMSAVGGYIIRISLRS